jgi:hypothetical protein
VKIPVSELKPGAHVKGTTIAELGNRNRPLDMIVYQKDGKDYLLLANNSRGVMKIPTEGADATESITSRVDGDEGPRLRDDQGDDGDHAARQARLGPRPGPGPCRFGLSQPEDGRPAVNATEFPRATAGSRHLAGPGLLPRAIPEPESKPLTRPPGTFRRGERGRRDGLVLGAALVLAALTPLMAIAGPDRPEVRWKVAGDRHLVEVAGLDRSTLDHMNSAEFDEARWGALLRVAVHTGDGPASDRRAMLGTYRVEEGLVRFRPRFPLERGMTYEAVFDPSRLPGAGDVEPNAPPIVVPLTLEAPSNAATTSLVRVDPAVETLPENLLKFYLTFSAPMSRGQAYDRVHLLDASGKAIDSPFLELGEELWDPSATRLTLLFDPGRIKTGLRPRDEVGPSSRRAESYTLVVDEAWPDAQGRPLLRGGRKHFRVGPADHTSPDPASWTDPGPRAGSRDPSSSPSPSRWTCALPGPAGQRPRPGGTCPPRARRDRGRRARWSFLPDADWREGSTGIVVGRDLEDLAGNSVGRPFEVDTISGSTLRRTGRAGDACDSGFPPAPSDGGIRQRHRRRGRCAPPFSPGRRCPVGADEGSMRAHSRPRGRGLCDPRSLIRPSRPPSPGGRREERIGLTR